MSLTTSDVKKLHLQDSITLDKSLTQLARKMRQACEKLENRDTLVQFIQKVEIQYQKPSEYESVNWFYSWFRERTPDLRLLLSEFKNLDSNAWLEGLHAFLNKGRWESESANTQLFKKIIQNIPGYEKEEINYVLDNKKIFEQIKVKFLSELCTPLHQQKAQEQRVEERKQKLAEEQEAAKEKELANISDVTLKVPDLDDESSHDVTDEKRFLVVMQKNKSGMHELIWRDRFGGEERLGYKSNLDITKIIKECDENGIQKLSNEKRNAIRLFCQNAIYSKLNAIKLAFSEKQALEQGSVFLIEHKDSFWFISWYDSTHKKMAVDLKSYSELDVFLQKLTHDDLALLAEDEHLARQTLQTLLLQYKKPVTVVKEDLKANALQMLRAQHGVALVCASDLNKLPKYKLIEGTYFLTKASDHDGGFRWELYQRREKVFTLIDTSSWKLFNKVLNELEGKSPEEVKAIKSNSGAKSPFDLLRGVIKSAEDGTLLNLAVDLDTVDSVEELENYEASDSYVLYQDNENLAIRYYDTLGKGLDIEINSVKGLDEVFRACLGKKPSELSNQQLEEVAALIEGVKPREKVKTTLQLNVKNILQKRHGITLVCSNDLKTVPNFKKIEGTYFLTKSSGMDESPWQLYVRRDRQFVALDILQWRKAQAILASIDVEQAEELPLKQCNELREFIKSVERNEEVNLLLFDSQHDFELHEQVPDSYVLIKEGIKFKLGYLDLDRNYSAIKASKVEGLKEIIKSQKDLLPSQITEEQLIVIERALASNVNKTLSVIGVDDIDLHQAKPDTFVVYKKSDTFCLRYYDTLNKPIEVVINKIGGLENLLYEHRLREPSQLKEVMSSIADMLLDFKPNSKLDIGNFKKIEQALRGKLKSQQKAQASAPGQLDMTNFESLATVLGGSVVKEHSKVTAKQPETHEMTARKALLEQSLFANLANTGANQSIPPAPPLPDQNNKNDVIPTPPPLPTDWDASLAKSTPGLFGAQKIEQEGTYNRVEATL